MDGYFENEFAIFWISESILFFEYKPDVVIDLVAAQRIVADRIQMQKEKAYPVLCDIRGIADSDKAARDYLAQHGSVLAKAVSILVHQSVSILMISFYLKISKPQVPTRIFTDKSDALEFLKAFI
ncbi:hypothetical protein SAMN05216269_11419 [Flavobacterium xinjiangense]|uniref:DUF7793 domain-containing protein n=2 Tax=Flavobacterium xinjiangense TaxID=178356 RepID=A0A1M7P612_9FLAO|nr:hypothetical protein SAMN05216269_11419 [Flavobacterium xinjiangense]